MGWHDTGLVCRKALHFLRSGTEICVTLDSLTRRLWCRGWLPAASQWRGSQQAWVSEPRLLASWPRSPSLPRHSQVKRSRSYWRWWNRVEISNIQSQDCTRDRRLAGQRHQFHCLGQPDSSDKRGPFRPLQSKQTVWRLSIIEIRLLVQIWRKGEPDCSWPVYVCLLTLAVAWHEWKNRRRALKDRDWQSQFVRFRL